MAMAPTMVTYAAFGSAPFMRSAIDAAISAKMAAGVSCGTLIAPGNEVSMATTTPTTSAPKSIKPIPPARNGLRSPEKINAAREISMLMVTMAAISPAVRLGRRRLG